MDNISTGLSCGALAVDGSTNAVVGAGVHLRPDYLFRMRVSVDGIGWPGCGHKDGIYPAGIGHSVRTYHHQ